MILVDTGPLVSAIDYQQVDASRRLRQVFSRPGEAFFTSAAVLTEALHLAGRDAGWAKQSLIWTNLDAYGVRVLQLRPTDLSRTQQLMERYANVPMDFADATLVALAEYHDVKRVLTLDSDFFIYRIHDREAFDVINPLA